MNIGIVNCDKNDLLFDEFSVTDELSEIDGIFIYWKSDAESIVHQTEILDDVLDKNLPIIIFDFDQNLNEKEAKFLKSKNVILLEPSIQPRKYFEYFPFWLNDIKNTDIPLFDDTEKPIHLIFIDDFNQRFNTFEKYFLKFAEVESENFKISTIETPPLIKAEIYEKYGISFDGNVTKAQFTILLDSNIHYNNGYLSRTFIYALNNGVVPLLPHEHRFYHCLFNGLVVNKLFDIKYFISQYNFLQYSAFCDIMDNIRKYYPEMLVTYANEKIKDFFYES